ncbi:MAG: DUF222 domain-containing protein [Acidimicrobiales bacterium]
MPATVSQGKTSHPASPVWADDDTLIARLARVGAELDGLVDYDLDGVDRGELGDALVVSQQLRAKLTAVEAGLVGCFDAARSYRAEGSRSTATWLAQRSNTPRQTIQAVVRLARRLRSMPATRAALGEGRLAPERAEVLARQAGSPRKPVADAFVVDEDELVDSAVQEGFGEFCRQVGYWRDRVDPDGGEPHADKLHDQRRVHLSQSFEGQWFLDGLLEPIAGEEVHESLRRIYDELHRSDRRAAEAIHGEGCAEDLLARTAPQRRADALVEMARRAMAAPAGSRQPRPLVSVLVGYETFHGPVREMFNRTVLTSGQIARLLTDADIERIVFAPASRNISDLGRKTRLFTAAQRRVVEIRDRTCWHPDCDEPAERCDMDHRPHGWAEGGRTDICNCRPGCPLHNRVTPNTGTDPPT